MPLQESVKSTVTCHEKHLLEDFIKYLKQHAYRIGEYYYSEFDVLSDEELNKEVDTFLQLRSEQSSCSSVPKEVIDWKSFGRRLGSYISDCIDVAKPLCWNQCQVLVQMVSNDMQIPTDHAPILDKVEQINDTATMHLRCPKRYDPSDPDGPTEVYRTVSVQLR